MGADMSRGSRAHSANWIGDIPVLGPEDIAIDHEAGIAYVSSQDRLRTKWWLPGVLGKRTTDWNERGRMYSVNLRKGLTAQEMNVVLPADSDFHPTGMDLYVDPSGDRRMFVVNWRAESEFSIEVFDITQGKLSHAETVTSSHLTLPNAIVAVSKTQFYVSNSLSLPPPVQPFEQAFCLPTGNVLFHDLDSGTTWPRVACGIPFANGLALDRKRNRLFVASTVSSRLLAFPFNAEKPWERLSAPRDVGSGLHARQSGLGRRKEGHPVGGRKRVPEEHSLHVCAQRHRAVPRRSHPARRCVGDESLPGRPTKANVRQRRQ